MTTNVNETRLRLYLDALRSGKYRQGQGRLNRNNTQFCCLGVMCEVAMDNGCAVHKEYDDDTGYYTYSGNSAFLPIQVLRWYGLNEEELSPELRYRGYYLPATKANDYLNWTFEQIADAFEETFLPKPKRTPYRDPKTGRFAKLPVPLTDLGRHLHKFVTTKG